MTARIYFSNVYLFRNVGYSQIRVPAENCCRNILENADEDRRDKDLEFLFLRELPFRLRSKDT